MEWQTDLPVSFESLTLAQKSLICNGCGGSDSWFKPTHADLFRPGCQPHDYDYACGGNIWDKIKADWKLRANLRRLVKTLDIQALRDNLIMDDTMLPDLAVRQIYYKWADAYFAGVLVGGAKYFRFGEKRWPAIVMDRV